MKKLTLITLLFAFSFSMSGCLKDPLANSLEGEWEVTSWRSGGLELIDPLYVASFTMDFGDYDSADQEGDVDWTVRFSDGSSTSLSGTYEVDQEDSELTVTFDGDSETFEIDLDGDDLELSNGTETIEAERD